MHSFCRTYHQYNENSFRNNTNNSCMYVMVFKPILHRREIGVLIEPNDRQNINDDRIILFFTLCHDFVPICTSVGVKLLVWSLRLTTNDCRKIDKIFNSVRHECVPNEKWESFITFSFLPVKNVYRRIWYINK